MLQELYEQYKDTFSKSDHKLIQYLLRNEQIRWTRRSSGGGGGK